MKRNLPRISDCCLNVAPDQHDQQEMEKNQISNPQERNMLDITN